VEQVDHFFTGKIEELEKQFESAATGAAPGAIDRLANRIRCKSPLSEDAK